MTLLDVVLVCACAHRRRTALLLAASFLFAVGACDCGEPLATLVPGVVVRPDSLDWGTVAVGLPAPGEVQIANRGTGTLDVVAVTVEPGDAGFTLVSAPTRVQPQGAEPVQLEFTPPFSGDYGAELVVVTDDQDTPEVRVPLRATGGAGHLVVDPDPIDLGIAHEGPGASRIVTVTNDGFDFVSIASAAFVDDAHFVVEDALLPASLAPGESTLLTVALHPTAAMLAGLDEPILQATLRLDTTIGPVHIETQARINLAPVARAVERDTRLTTVKAGAGAWVYVDGSDTFDPEDDAFVFQWSVAERPAGSVAGIVGFGQPEVRMTPDRVGRYVVRLRATDEHGAWREAELTVLPRDLAVVLSWCREVVDDECATLPPDERARRCCGQADLDLHFIAPGGVLGDYGACPAACDPETCTEETDAHAETCRSAGLDCAYANRAPEWGVQVGGQPGRVDDPRLDTDGTTPSSGPEIVSLDSPAPGDYRVVVHHCSDPDDLPAVATVQIFDEGAPLGTTAPQELPRGSAWIALVLRRQEGQWQVVAQPDIFENNVPDDLCSR